MWSVLCLVAVYSVVSIKDASCMPAGVISAKGLGGAGARRARAEVVYLDRASKEEKHFYEMYPDALENKLALRETDEVKERSTEGNTEDEEGSNEDTLSDPNEPVHSADDAVPIEGHSGESIPEEDTQHATQPARDHLHTRCTFDSPSAEEEHRTLAVEVDFFTEDEALATNTATTEKEHLKHTKTTRTFDGGDNAVEQTTESKAPYASPAAYTFTETGFIDDD